MPIEPATRHLVIARHPTHGPVPPSGFLTVTFRLPTVAEVLIDLVRPPISSRRRSVQGDVTGVAGVLPDRIGSLPNRRQLGPQGGQFLAVVLRGNDFGGEV